MLFQSPDQFKLLRLTYFEADGTNAWSCGGGLLGCMEVNGKGKLGLCNVSFITVSWKHAINDFFELSIALSMPLFLHLKIIKVKDQAHFINVLGTLQTGMWKKSLWG